MTGTSLGLSSTEVAPGDLVLTPGELSPSFALTSAWSSQNMAILSQPYLLWYGCDLRELARTVLISVRL